MDYKRYTIKELSEATNTSKYILRSWVQKGFLQPVQKAGIRNKYSIDSFLSAEKLSIQEFSKIKTKNNNEVLDKNFYNLIFSKVS